MGISEDIKQENFASSHQKAVINILYTSNWISERTKKILEPSGLTEQQFNVLRILRGSNPKPLSTLQIRERMLDKMSDTSRIVDRLVKKNLIEKCTCKSDKRLVDVTISEKGLKALAVLDESVGFHYSDVYKLPAEDMEALSNLLDKLRESDTYNYE